MEKRITYAAQHNSIIRPLFPWEHCFLGKLQGCRVQAPVGELINQSVRIADGALGSWEGKGAESAAVKSHRPGL